MQVAAVAVARCGEPLRVALDEFAEVAIRGGQPLEDNSAPYELEDGQGHQIGNRSMPAGSDSGPQIAHPLIQDRLPGSEPCSLCLHPFDFRGQLLELRSARACQGESLLEFDLCKMIVSRLVFWQTCLCQTISCNPNFWNQPTANLDLGLV